MAAELPLQQQKNEIAILKAIYGDEFTVHSQIEWDSMLSDDTPEELMHCSVSRELNGKGKATVSFWLPKEYPNVRPHASILCDSVSRDATVELLREANETMEMNVQMGEPCLQQIVELVFSFASSREGDGSECLQSQSAVNGGSSRSEESPLHCSSTAVMQDLPSKEPTCPWPAVNVAVVHLDHMHNSKLYTKKLTKWSKECGVHCTLVDCGVHCIVGVMLGEHAAIDSFLRAWKTRNVDEDARGRPCKEKMIRVLCREVRQPLVDPPEAGQQW